MGSAHGPTTLGALVAPELAADRERVAVIEAARHVSFADLDRDADRFAAALLALGLREGDRVALWMESCAEWLAAAIGIARAGCVLVTLDAAASGSELARALSETQARVLFVSGRPIHGDRMAGLKEAVPHCFRGDPGTTHCTDLPELRAVVTSGGDVPDGCFAQTAVLGLGRSISRDRLVMRILKADPSTPAWIAYGACLDGRHRGTVLSHAALGQRIGSVARLLGDPVGPVLVASPVTDVSAAVIGSLSALWRGAAQVLADSADVGETLSWIPRVRADEIVVSPYVAQVLLRHPDRPRWGVDAIRLCVIQRVGLAIDPVGERHRADGATRILELVAASETAGPFAVTWPPEQRGAFAGQEVRIANGSGGAPPAGDGLIGDLELRGDGTMLRYQADEPATSRMLHDGWLRLPVPATFDASGQLDLDPGHSAASVAEPSAPPVAPFPA